MTIATQSGVRVWQHGGAINGFDAMVTMFPDEKLAIVVIDNRLGPSVTGTMSVVYRGVTVARCPRRRARRPPSACPPPPSAVRWLVATSLAR